MAPISTIASGRRNAPAAASGHDALADIGSGQPVVDAGSGTGLGAGITLYHDAEQPRSIVLAAHRKIDVTIYQFTGTYFSLAFALPDRLRQRIAPGYRFDVSIDAAVNRPLTTFLRLNTQVAAAGEILHHAVVLKEGVRDVHFDLDALPAQIPDSAWIDVIFSRPRMVGLALTKVAFAVGVA